MPRCQSHTHIHKQGRCHSVKLLGDEKAHLGWIQLKKKKNRQKTPPKNIGLTPAMWRRSLGRYKGELNNVFAHKKFSDCDK